MPTATASRTAFPVLRRGRERLSLRPQDSDAAPSSCPISPLAAPQQEIMETSDQIVPVQRADATKSSIADPARSTTTVISTPAGDAIAAAGSHASQSHHHRRRHRRPRRPSLHPRRTRPAAPPQTTAPPLLQAPPPPPLEECSICQDPVGVANPEGQVETWAQLQCGHRFGHRCILTWIIDSINQNGYINPCCPVCRREICHPCGHLILPPASAESSTSDDEDEDENENEEDGRDDGQVGETSNSPESLNHRCGRRSRFSILSLVHTKSSAAISTSTAVLRVVSKTIVRAVKLSRRLSNLFRRRPQQLFYDPESPDVVHMVPPEGFCVRCRDSRDD